MESSKRLNKVFGSSYASCSELTSEEISIPCARNRLILTIGTETRNPLDPSLTYCTGISICSTLRGSLCRSLARVSVTCSFIYGIVEVGDYPPSMIRWYRTSQVAGEKAKDNLTMTMPCASNCQSTEMARQESRTIDMQMLHLDTLA